MDRPPLGAVGARDGAGRLGLTVGLHSQLSRLPRRGLPSKRGVSAETKAVSCPPPRGYGRGPRGWEPNAREERGAVTLTALPSGLELQ